VALAKRKKKKKALKRTCKVVRSKKTGRRRKVCKPVRRKKKAVARRPAAPQAPKRTETATPKAPARPAPTPAPTKRQPVPSAAAPPVTTPIAPLPPPPRPPRTPLPERALPVQQAWGRRQAERLLWRAGFGPRPGDLDRFAAMTPTEAVHALTRPAGAATLTPADKPPRDERGNPIDPENVWGHDHLWWLDRMVRSDQPLVERMTLIWHDWFATSQDGVGDQRYMLEQNELLRSAALGSFERIAVDITTDRAMLIWLDGLWSGKWSPNENYARELMELFTLGADRGAYTETDVRELARALTGWRADWNGSRVVNFRFDARRFDDGVKRLWAGRPHARSGNLGSTEAVQACLDNPYHPSFFVLKLWSYFVPTPPDAATKAALEALYVNGGYAIRPVVEAILLHPDLYDGGPLAKPPVVFVAGMLRARGRVIDHQKWTWGAEGSGQFLFRPPNVSGWNDQAWLDTSTLRGRWYLAYYLLENEYVPNAGYPTTETPQEAVVKALNHWGDPTITPETRAELERFATTCLPATMQSWERAPLRAYRQNALRHLIATSPDLHLC
jgi:uncharacterized protein (DUF1800 family)